MNVILFSGGLDSAVLSARFLERNPEETVILFTLVNGKQNAREVHCASELYNKLRDKYGKRVIHRLKMLDVVQESPEYTPFRNSLFVLSAANYFGKDKLNIHIGLIHFNTPLADGTHEWLENINKLLKLENSEIEIIAPFLDKDKDEVYLLAKKYGISLKDTYSCNYGDVECGKCADCKARETLSRW